MGWFDEQIEFRKKHERELLADSIENIARSVTGRKISGEMKDQADIILEIYLGMDEAGREEYFAASEIRQKAYLEEVLQRYEKFEK